MAAFSAGKEAVYSSRARFHSTIRSWWCAIKNTRWPLGAISLPNAATGPTLNWKVPRGARCQLAPPSRKAHRFRLSPCAEVNGKYRPTAAQLPQQPSAGQQRVRVASVDINLPERCSRAQGVAQRKPQPPVMLRPGHQAWKTGQPRWAHPPLLRASFIPCLTAMPLRLAMTSPPSVKGTFTFKLSDMLGTQKRVAEQRQRGGNGFVNKLHMLLNIRDVQYPSPI